MKRTEILATIGPATLDIIDKLYDNGMNGIRINSSHGSHDFHKTVIERSRKANPGGYIIYDIKGPKIRLGDIPEPLNVKAGDALLLRTDIPKKKETGYPAINSFDEGIPVTYKELDQYIKPGQIIY